MVRQSRGAAVANVSNGNGAYGRAIFKKEASGSALQKADI